MLRAALNISFVIALATGTPARADTATAQRVVQQVMSSPSYKAAVQALDRDHERIIGEVITLTEIPAPPFKEAKRAAAYRSMLQAAGLSNVEIDAGATQWVSAAAQVLPVDRS